MFPKIDSPCPLKWKTLPSAGRDFCTLCRRRVHNLDAMNTQQRQEFLAACSDTVCVAYTVRTPRRAVAAATLGFAAALSFPAAQAFDAVPAASGSETPAAAAYPNDDEATEETEAILLGSVLPLGLVVDEEPFGEEAFDDESLDEEFDDDSAEESDPLSDDQQSYRDAEFIAAPEDETPR